jgi:hypothetical protein
VNGLSQAGTHEVGYMSRHRAPRRAHGSRIWAVRRALLLVTAVAGVTAAVGAGQSMLSAEPAPAGPVDRSVAANLAAAPAWAAPDERWSGVLARLDDRRALAFSRADAHLLAKVYVPGSALRARDARVIEAYARRDLRVVGLRMTILALRVEDQTASTADLSVVDRIMQARAVDSSGRSRPLPHDRPTAHRLLLRRLPTGWRIAAISDPSPMPPLRPPTPR